MKELLLDRIWLDRLWYTGNYVLISASKLAEGKIVMEEQSAGHGNKHALIEVDGCLFIVANYKLSNTPQILGQLHCKPLFTLLSEGIIDKWESIPYGRERKTKI